MGKASQAIRKGIRHPLKSALSAGGAASPPVNPLDVWAWTTEKYRIRSVVLLLINAALFAGLGCFTYWLRTGEYSPFGSSNYWSMWWMTFDPTHDQQRTLMDYLIYPIPVQEVGLMMVIMGLLLASLTAIPILVSMLYRFPFSLIFTAIICFVAVLPWLAIVVTFGCYLARWKPLRFSFRYATALIALLPCAGYYVMATQGSSSQSDLAPLAAATLYLPWVLAIIAACIVMAIVLTIARIVNYRPGAIAPLLALMFAFPVILFEVKIGRSELDYRLLEATYGPFSKTHLQNNIDVSPVLVERVERRWRELGDHTASKTAVIEQVKLQMLTDTSVAVAEQREEVIRACESFRDSYPTSRHLPSALYIEGCAYDTRFDRAYFSEHMRVRYYQDFPNEASKDIWDELYTKHPDAVGRPVAAYRLAILETRNGNVDRAASLLESVIDQKPTDNNSLAETGTNPGLSNLLGKQPAGITLGIDAASVQRKIRMLHALLIANRDPHQKDLALQRLFQLDSYHWRYADNLRVLLAEINNRKLTTKLGDNVELALVLAETRGSRSLRLERLKELISRLESREDSDALPEALFQLGRAYQIDSIPDIARDVYDRLIREHANSIWAQEAKSSVAAMGVTGPTGGTR